MRSGCRRATATRSPALLMQAGEPFGIVPYGTEALGVMRIEKGHVAGNELDGRTTADDLGLGRMMSSKKDFVGRVMAARPALLDPQASQARRFSSTRSAQPALCRRASFAGRSSLGGGK